MHYQNVRIMKPIFKKTLLFCTAVLVVQSAFPQPSEKSFKKSDKMDHLPQPKGNKEVIAFLYDSILNQKKFEKLGILVSDNYTNEFGGKGVEGFQKSILELAKAFPDAQWKIEDIIAEGNKVAVKQKFTGTHTYQFQNIRPTNKRVCVDGLITYEFQNRKIIRSQTQTDRLGFLQQSGVLPVDFPVASAKRVIPGATYFIDKFSVPQKAINEFTKQITYNREFLKTLPGYVSGDAYELYDSVGNLTILTIAGWKSMEKLNEAKTAVQAEFKRIGFNPVEFYERLKIKMERGQYTILNE